MIKTSANSMRLALACFSLVTLAALSPLSLAEDYYRWVGKDGVVHYGSRPPAGVEAVKIKGSGKAAPTSSSATPAGTAPVSDADAAKARDAEQKEVIAQRKQQCADEKARVENLKTPGRRIRMQQPDGSTKYLSPEEVATEISVSQEFINQACK